MNPAALLLPQAFVRCPPKRTTIYSRPDSRKPCLAVDKGLGRDAVSLAGKG